MKTNINEKMIKVDERGLENSISSKIRKTSIGIIFIEDYDFDKKEDGVIAYGYNYDIDKEVEILIETDSLKEDIVNILKVEIVDEDNFYKDLALEYLEDLDFTLSSKMIEKLSQELENFKMYEGDYIEEFPVNTKEKKVVVSKGSYEIVYNIKILNNALLYNRVLYLHDTKICADEDVKNVGLIDLEDISIKDVDLYELIWHHELK